MRCVWPPTHRLQLVSQSALPQVSITGQGSLAASTPRRSLAGGVLPCGLHLARATRFGSVAEQTSRLQPVILCRFGDPAHDRGRPAPPWRGHRLSDGAAYVGPNTASPSASALCRSRRWSISGG